MHMYSTHTCDGQSPASAAARAQNFSSRVSSAHPSAAVFVCHNITSHPCSVVCEQQNNTTQAVLARLEVLDAKLPKAQRQAAVQPLAAHGEAALLARIKHRLDR